MKLELKGKGGARFSLHLIGFFIICLALMSEGYDLKVIQLSVSKIESLYKLTHALASTNVIIEPVSY